MTEFSGRALDMEKARKIQEFADERRRQKREYDSDSSNDNSSDGSISEQEQFSMNQEHAQRNRDEPEPDNEWAKKVSSHPRETMEDFLWMVASLPIIDLSFIRNYSYINGETCPCVCPFHERFDKLRYRFIDRYSFMGKQLCQGTFVHKDKNSFVQHCESQADFPHLLLMHYIQQMYPKQKSKNVKKRKNSNNGRSSTRR